MVDQQVQDTTPGGRASHRPAVRIGAIIAAITLLLIATIIAGIVTFELATVGALATGAVALGYLSIKRPQIVERAWDDIRFRLRFATRSTPVLTDADGSDTTSIHLATTPDDRYWYLPAAFLCAVAAVVLGVRATMEIWDIAFDDVVPWLLLIGAAVAAVFALMAVSYAPPGPNWVQRLAGIDGRVLLAMLGLAIVVFATLEYFDFQQGDVPPSDWWLALGALGLLVGLAGTSPRSVAVARRPTAREAIDEAQRAAEFAAHARVYEKRASVVGPSAGSSDALDAARAMAEQSATVAESSAEQAEQHAERAQELERSLGARVTDASQHADAAEAASAAAFAAHRQAQSAVVASEKDLES